MTKRQSDELAARGKDRAAHGTSVVGPDDAIVPLSPSEVEALRSVGVDPVPALVAQPTRSQGPPVELVNIPGIEALAGQFRTELTSAQIVAFFAVPQPDLEDDDGFPMTPAAWLDAGRNPRDVAELARGL